MTYVSGIVLGMCFERVPPTQDAETPSWAKALCENSGVIAEWLIDEVLLYFSLVARLADTAFPAMTTPSHCLRR